MLHPTPQVVAVDIDFPFEAAVGSAQNNSVSDSCFMQQFIQQLR